MRLIDGDALFDDAFEVWGNEADGGETNLFMGMINNAPTIAPPPNDPLTLEQLREMDGEPVWIESKTGQYGKYWLTQSDSGIVSFRNGYGYCFQYEVVTTQWGSKIYRRKPEEGGT